MIKHIFLLILDRKTKLLGRSFSRGSCLHNLTRILHFRRRILRNRDLGSRESVSSRRVRIVDGNRISRTGSDCI